MISTYVLLNKEAHISASELAQLFGLKTPDGVGRIMFTFRIKGRKADTTHNKTKTYYRMGDINRLYIW